MERRASSNHSRNDENFTLDYLKQRLREALTVETWISPAFVDLTCICGFTSLIKATLPIRKLPQSEGESFDSAFLDSTLKKLLNLATKDYNLIP